MFSKCIIFSSTIFFIAIMLFSCHNPVSNDALASLPAADSPAGQSTLPSIQYLSDTQAISGLTYMDTFDSSDHLLGACDVVCSQDNKHVYVVSSSNASITWFSREADGSLTYKGMIQDWDLLWDSISLTISGDGKFVYVTSRNFDTVSWYRRDSETGDLTVDPIGQHYFTGSQISTCMFITISSDGLFAYVGCGYPNMTIAWFSRDVETGKLTYLDKYSDIKIKGTQALVFSPDEEYLYSASSAARSVAWFKRDKTTGALTYLDRYRNRWTLGGVRSLSISNDGKHIYTASFKGHYLNIFSRDSSDGSLSPVEDIYDDVNLQRSYYTAVSADDKYVFAIGRDSNAVVGYERNSQTGRLTQKFVYQNDETIRDPRCVTVSPDNKNIYITGLRSHLISWFKTY